MFQYANAIEIIYHFLILAQGLRSPTVPSHLRTITEQDFSPHMAFDWTDHFYQHCSSSFICVSMHPTQQDLELEGRRALY